jgi:predicted transcriptional regulator
MNKKLETLLELVSTWPEEAQAELVKSIVEIEARHTGVYRLSDDEKAAIEEALASVDRGEIATDEEMAALFKQHGV